MKLIYAIIQDEDERNLTRALIENDFSVTRVSSSGGFLKKGNTTLMMGVDEKRIDEIFEIIRSHSTRRSMQAPDGSGTVSTGGATVFMVDAERFAKF